MEKFRFEQVVKDHQDSILEEGERMIDYHRTIRWVMFDWGWVIETSFLDDYQTTTIETLISYNGETAVLIHRFRYGPDYNEMQQYLRDDFFPVPSCVRLLP